VFTQKERRSKHMPTNQNVVVVIAAFNEESTIGRIVDEVVKAYPVIVVDDGSTDKTVVEAKKAGATAIIRHEHNMGLYHAFLSAFEWKTDSDIVVTIDGDGQHDPANISDLLAALNSRDAHLAIGLRKKKGLGEWFYEILFSLVIAFFTGTRVHDPSCGMRAIRQNILHDILPEPKRFGFHQEMLVNALLKGYRVVEVPIKVHKRTYGTSRIKRNPWIHLSFVVSVLSVLLKRGLSEKLHLRGNGLG